MTDDAKRLSAVEKLFPKGSWEPDKGGHLVFFAGEFEHEDGSIHDRPEQCPKCSESITPRWPKECYSCGWEAIDDEGG
jgi:hypothetical protein